jgi:hypothetical protein
MKGMYHVLLWAHNTGVKTVSRTGVQLWHAVCIACGSCLCVLGGVGAMRTGNHSTCCLDSSKCAMSFNARLQCLPSLGQAQGPWCTVALGPCTWKILAVPCLHHLSHPGATCDRCSLWQQQQQGGVIPPHERRGSCLWCIVPAFECPVTMYSNPCCRAASAAACRMCCTVVHSVHNLMCNDRNITSSQ